VWLVAALLGALTLATGLLSPADAGDVTQRVAPVLVFLVAVTVLAELADRAQVFDVAATRAARLARGRTPLLFALVVVLATVTTVVLSLDTTAVLVTPVVLAMARRLDLDPLPFALAAVWLANTASLLLPVSNLTNLLAVDRLDLTTTQYASRVALPALVAVVVTAGLLAVWQRRSLRGRYQVPEVTAPQDRVLFAGAAAACVLLVPALLLGVPVAWAASASAAVVVGFALCRRRSLLTFSLVPWRLVLMVEGLFLVAAGGANAVNNLPAYLAVERVVPHDQLLALLLGVNLGPLVLPWGSLATLLWAERCRARGVQVGWLRFGLAGLVLVPLLLLTTVPLL
jgi:arsenical pump membrane protein